MAKGPKPDLENRRSQDQALSKKSYPLARTGNPSPLQSPYILPLKSPQARHVRLDSLQKSRYNSSSTALMRSKNDCQAMTLIEEPDEEALKSDVIFGWWSLHDNDPVMSENEKALALLLASDLQNEYPLTPTEGSSKLPRKFGDPVAILPYSLPNGEAEVGNRKRDPANASSRDAEPKPKAFPLEILIHVGELKAKHSARKGGSSRSTVPEGFVLDRQGASERYSNPFHQHSEYTNSLSMIKDATRTAQIEYAKLSKETTRNSYDPESMQVENDRLTNTAERLRVELAQYQNRDIVQELAETRKNLAGVRRTIDELESQIRNEYPPAGRMCTSRCSIDSFHRE